MEKVGFGKETTMDIKVGRKAIAEASENFAFGDAAKPGSNESPKQPNMDFVG